MAKAATLKEAKKIAREYRSNRCFFIVDYVTYLGLAASQIQPKKTITLSSKLIGVRIAILLVAVCTRTRQIDICSAQLEPD